jgi:hypothetical protein
MEQRYEWKATDPRKRRPKTVGGQWVSWKLVVVKCRLGVTFEVFDLQDKSSLYINNRQP